MPSLSRTSRMREVRAGHRDVVRSLMTLLPLWVSCTTLCAEPFKFSTAEQQEQEKQRAAEEQRAQAIQQLVSVPCRQRLKNRKIVQLIAERSTSGRWEAQQDRYESLIAIIDARLHALGLNTFTAQQIKGAIAQAEIDAYFNNDPDGALAASKRLAAEYILRGDITTMAGVNRVVGVNEVAVDVQLVLTSASGREISRVEGHSDAYSGTDTLATAAQLLRQQADPLVAQLYNDYCRKADAHGRAHVSE
jgi:hypothetical protein